jgi:tRNA-splicing ligase RtcB
MKKVFASNLDQATIQQIEEISNVSIFKQEKIAIMADAHAGKGACVGFTSTFNERIIPNIVGVDIGCGMLMKQMQSQIEKFIDYRLLQSILENTVMRHSYQYIDESLEKLWREKLSSVTFKIDINYHLKQIGTLGGGNHFIEIVKQSDDPRNRYIIVHSGSRNLGSIIAEHHQKIAEKNFHYSNEIRDNVLNTNKSGSIEDPSVITGLEYLNEHQTVEYLNDMKIAQEYAKANREAILSRIDNAYHGVTNEYLTRREVDSIQCIHNYIDLESKIIRKGAIDGRNVPVIIPLNMRDGVIFGMGNSNEDMNWSLPHGAGRTLSREQAKKQITMEKFQEDMKNVISFTVNEKTIDEAPDSYKNSEYIKQMIKPFVNDLKVLVPIFNSKNFGKLK